jgi:hypothetical protein
MIAVVGKATEAVKIENLFSKLLNGIIFSFKHQSIQGILSF